MSFIYLATPYTDPDPAVMEERFRKNEKYCASLLEQGVWVYSPIVHCHEMAKRHKLPKGFEFWREYNFAMLSKSSEVRVLELLGWVDSSGVQAEIAMAVKLGIIVRGVQYPVALSFTDPKEDEA